MGKLMVGIYNEEGEKECDCYEVVSNSVGIKKIVRVKNVVTGDVRLIHKDRIFVMERDEMSEQKKKKRPKKKPLVKFNLAELQGGGILFKSRDKKSMKAGGSKIEIESFCMVSEDGKKWKHFNLYNHSLGRNAKLPEFGDDDHVKRNLCGDVEAIQQYLKKKGYELVRGER